MFVGSLESVVYDVVVMSRDGINIQGFIQDFFLGEGNICVRES